MQAASTGDEARAMTAQTTHRIRQQRNLCGRLCAREVGGHRPSTSILTIRSYYDSLHPMTMLSHLDAPPVHFCRFTPDGRYLVCFAAAGQELVVFSVKAVSMQASMTASDADAGDPPAYSFSSFFHQEYCSVVVVDAREQLCKDFCLLSSGGQFLLLASQTPAQRPDAGAHRPRAGVNDTAVPEGRPTRTDANMPLTEAMPGAQQDVWPPGATNPVRPMHHAGQQPQTVSNASNPPTEAVPGMPVVSSTTLHLVRACSGEVLDSVIIHNDFVHLHQHNGVSLCDDLLAVLAVRSQTTHLFQITRDGKLMPVGSVGPLCSTDDALSLRKAEFTEDRWRTARMPSAAGASTSFQPASMRGGNTGGSSNAVASGVNSMRPHTPPGHTVRISRLGLHTRGRPVGTGYSGSEDVPGGSETQGSAPMLVGIKQRMLAYIFRTCVLRPGTSARQRQADARLFFRNFDMLCSTVLWRVQLLPCAHMLMDWGFMCPPEAPGQPWTPQYSQYIMLYDAAAVKVLAFFPTASQELLPLLLRYAAELQATVGSSLWERLTFTPSHAMALAQTLGVVLPRNPAQHPKHPDHQLLAIPSSLQPAGRSAATGQSAARASSAPTLTSALASAAASSMASSSHLSPAQSLHPTGSADGSNGLVDFAGTSVQRARDSREVLKRMQAAVPCSPQSLCASPLLDPAFYVYDEKFVGPVIRARPVSEQPLKFFLRSRPNRVAFKLNASGGEAGSAASSERSGRRTCLHLFHPNLPMVLTVSQANTMTTRLVLHMWRLDADM